MNDISPAILVGVLIVAILVTFGFLLVLSGQEKQKRTEYTHWRILMATTADLDAAIAKLDTDVKALIAAVGTPVDLQPQVDAVNAIDAEVLAATPPTP